MSGPDIFAGNGWFAVPAGLMAHPIARHRAALKVLLAILARARRIPLEAELALDVGQAVIGTEELARDLGLGRQAVRGAISALVAGHFVTTRATTRGTVITVLEFARYRTSRASEQPASQPSEQPASNQRATTKEREERRGRSSEIDPRAGELALELVSAIARRQPQSEPARKPGECAARWARELDALHRLDGRPWERIGEVLRWSQRDPFWQKNIRSGATLRKQFDALEAQMLPAKGSGSVVDLDSETEAKLAQGGLGW